MFSQKQDKKYFSKIQLDKKTCFFMMFFITSFFSISPLTARQVAFALQNKK